MLEAKLPDEYYGNWSRLVEDWRMKNQEKHETNKNRQTENDEHQEREKEKRDEAIKEISQILRDQREKANEQKTPEHLEQETTEELGAMSIEATTNPFTFLVGKQETARQAEEKQTEKLKRGAKGAKGRGKGFLSLQGSPRDTPQPETQNE
jgi:hypothetical protein